MSHEVFISYSAQDRETAEAILSALEARDIPCWMAPRDILPGMEYASGIIEAIETSRLLLLVLTNHSNDSPQVLREVERAVAKRVPILAFRRQEVILSKALEYFVSTHHWYDAAQGSLADHLPVLAETVRRFLRSDSKPRPIHSEPRRPGLEVTPPPAGRKSDVEPLLSSYAADDLGSGTEVTATAYLIFGLLTLWIYTVLAYWRLLSGHFEQRLKAFHRRLADRSLSPQAKEMLSTLTRTGFHLGSRWKWILAALYFMSLTLVCAITVETHLFAMLIISESFFNEASLIQIAAAATLFCLGTLFFMAYVCRKLRDHEYQEMLLVHFCEDPERFQMLLPSDGFVKRWAVNYNRIALFLILAVPMIFSPFLAVWHIHALIQEGKDTVHPIIIWALVTFGLGAVFHFFGVMSLLGMYNGHLHLERSQLLPQDHQARS
ncbi:MAG: toll/interleukin-1 receptor domain-containing protein [Thermodesulfobacteriota bacterium]